jgi:hypothetical protein
MPACLSPTILEEKTMKFVYKVRPQNLNYQQLDIADLDSGVQVRMPNLKGINEKQIGRLVRQVRDQFFSPSGPEGSVRYLIQKGFKPAKFKPAIFKV